MNLYKKAFLGVLPCIFILDIGTSINYIAHHNNNYEIEGKKVFEKADGFFAHTRLEINKDNSRRMIRYSLSDNLVYIDRDFDGNIENIFRYSNPFERNNYSEIFEKEKDFESYASVFEDAQKDFDEQMNRFRANLNSVFEKP